MTQLRNSDILAHQTEIWRDTQASGTIRSGLCCMFLTLLLLFSISPHADLLCVSRILQWNQSVFSIIPYSIKTKRTSWNLPFVLITRRLRFVDIPCSNRSLTGRVNIIINLDLHKNRKKILQEIYLQIRSICTLFPWQRVSFRSLEPLQSSKGHSELMQAEKQTPREKKKVTNEKSSRF